MPTPDGLAFYISPHPDDWFYFRGEVAYSDLHNPNNRVVIIFLTAGDAGYTDRWWEAREAGAIAAVNAAVLSPTTPPGLVTIPGTLHEVTRYEFGNGACYCLRIPENRDSPNPTDLLTNPPLTVQLTAVDGSTTYESWGDLCETLKSIVASECNSSGIQHPWINAPLYISNDEIDPGNHPDHIATSIAIKSFAEDFCNRAWWWSYSIRGREDMRILDPAAVDNKMILFNAYAAAVTTFVEAMGNPPDSAGELPGIPGEWDMWGSFSYAALASYGATDPYAFYPGNLLGYRDQTQNGSANISNPSIIGLGGWNAFRSIFSGGNGILYAVSQEGALLFYQDNGFKNVTNPSMIAQGGWDAFTFVFAGGEGIIYAVTQDGNLLFYQDQNQDGSGDVANPSIIGQGGWDSFKFVFSGGSGIIYAVTQDGNLLFYKDQTQDGSGDVANPSVIGQGGWDAFKSVFSGGNGIIYAVTQDGNLLSYQDQTQDGSGDVATPAIIGQGGWDAFKFVFSGGNGIIYSVVS